MIEYIDDRCCGWARELRDRPARYSSVLMDSAGGVPAGGSMPVSPDALEIERIVCGRLTDTSREIVIEHYIKSNPLLAKVKAMHVSRKTYYDLLDTAHYEIDRALNCVGSNLLELNEVIDKKGWRELVDVLSEIAWSEN